MKAFQIHMQLPTGESEIFPLPDLAEPGSTLSLGAGSDCGLRVRGEGIADQVLQLSLRDEGRQVWLESLGPDLHLSAGTIRIGEWPLGHSLTLGHVILTLQSYSQTKTTLENCSWPSGKKRWISHHPSGQALLQKIHSAAMTELPLYLQGETGTGKEVLAQAIHAWSPQKNAAFVPINCGAIPAELAESEFFGHLKGAYTGAQHHRVGALLQAHQGTLFLDEVADLRLDLQVKLLRFLENGEVRPVGSDRILHSKVRLICATHRPLLKLVREGKFRQDLYYRIASVTLEVPSLRERPEDILELSRRFALEYQKRLSPAATKKLLSYSWPGNVRQLRSVIENACALSGAGQGILLPGDLILHEEEGIALEEGSQQAAFMSLAEMEKRMLIHALRLSHGHRGKAAERLGIARSTLFEMIKRYELRPLRPSWVA